jgi:hypothetical protein
MRGLASKSTTTWFLGGRDVVAEFYKFHFEVVGAVQLTYTMIGLYIHGLSWYINTSYIISAASGGNVCRTFLDTSTTVIETSAPGVMATGTEYL